MVWEHKNQPNFVKNIILYKPVKNKGLFGNKK